MPAGSARLEESFDRISPIAPPRSRPERRPVTPRKVFRLSRSISDSGSPVEIEATLESGTSAPEGERTFKSGSPVWPLSKTRTS